MCINTQVVLITVNNALGTWLPEALYAMPCSVMQDMHRIQLPTTVGVCVNVSDISCVTTYLTNYITTLLKNELVRHKLLLLVA